MKFSCVVILLVLLPTSFVSAQPKPKTRSLFGVKLTPKVLALLTEVEVAFQKPLMEDYLEAGDMPGRSRVGEDGSPTILINRSDGRTLNVIAHELYHLKLKAMGYPAIYWRTRDPAILNWLNENGAQVAFNLRDPIEHFIFFGALRAIGINPGESFELELKQVLTDAEWQAVLHG